MRVKKTGNMLGSVSKNNIRKFRIQAINGPRKAAGNPEPVKKQMKRRANRLPIPE
jgi:hypothetical protein